MTCQDIHEKALFAQMGMYEKCMGRVVEYEYGSTSLDFHYIKFDPNHVRKERDLIKALVAHIVPYALKERKIRKAANPVSTVVHEAMSLFVQRDASGEAGELLLYMMTELFLEAPQLLAKMSLKTSAKLEYNGADGIHFRYNGPDDPLDVYLGESKIWDSVSSALDDAFESIQKVRSSGIAHEISLATENFKWLNPDIRDKIFHLLDPDSDAHSCRIHYVALVGFQFAPHGNRKTPETEEEFCERYESRADKIMNLTVKKLEERQGQGERTDDIIHIFYVPLSDVERFRAEFRSYLQTGRFDQ